MNKIEKTCPECQSKDITLNSQVNPVQDYIPGKDLKIERYPKYKCNDCSHTFDA